MGLDLQEPSEEHTECLSGLSTKGLNVDPSEPDPQWWRVELGGIIYPMLLGCTCMQSRLRVPCHGGNREALGHKVNHLWSTLQATPYVLKLAQSCSLQPLLESEVRPRVYEAKQKSRLNTEFPESSSHLLYP